MTDSIREVNRVLKDGGFLALTGFDTPQWYKLDNKHNDAMPVFKEDYAKRFLPLGYTLVEKRVTPMEEILLTKKLTNVHRRNFYIRKNTPICT